MLVGLIAVTFVVSACDGDPEESTDRFRVSTVARSLQDAGTARYAGTGTVHVQSGSGLKVTYQGAIDFAHDRSAVKVHGPGRKPKRDLSRTIVIGGAVYVDESGAGDGTSLASEAKPWVRFVGYKGQGVFGLTSVGDARQALRSLKRAGWQRERVGSAEVRDVPTIHYRFTLQPVAEPPEQVRVLSSGVGQDQTIDLWVDTDQRLRRLVHAYSDGAVDVSTDTEFFDFGAPVTIEAPPRDRVVVDDSSELTGDWTVVQEGRSGASGWRIYRAPTRHGECLAHETDPATPAGDFGATLRGRVPDQCSTTVRNEGKDLSEVLDFDEYLDSVQAVELPNGMVLLYGQVGAEVQSLTLQFKGGRTERIVPSDGWFALAMAPDELVETIVPEIPNTTARCPLDRDMEMYNCSSESDGPPPDRFPAPSMPGSVSTAPPGA